MRTVPVCDARIGRTRVSPPIMPLTIATTAKADFIVGRSEVVKLLNIVIPNRILLIMSILLYDQK